jgi:TorA maturation chaperone TorD
MEVQRIDFPGPNSRSTLPAEEQARADFYALLARLYTSGPDAALLSAIANAAPIAPLEAETEEEGVPPSSLRSRRPKGDAGLPGESPSANPDDLGARLAAAWAALAQASAATVQEAAGQEYDDLFVGVGKSELNLHASHWLTGFMMEKPLAKVRDTLAQLGFTRKQRAVLVEDHLAALCETMRLLIIGDDGRAPAQLNEQRAFFEQHIATWAFSCCAAIERCPVANYYRKVAQFTCCYLALERESLAME